MSAYAPNPTTASSATETGYASLSAGLLARKGEAMPSVDADAHAGVDIEMRPMVPSPTPPNAASQQRRLNATPPRAFEDPAGPRATALLPPANNHTQEDGTGRADPSASPPENWTIAASRRARSRRRSALRATDSDTHQRKATVTFRMAANEFVRMRFAARDLDMSCQTLILEAVDCYLEANDVDVVADDICDAEVNRLMRKKQKTPTRQKAASLVD